MGVVHTLANEVVKLPIEFLDIDVVAPCIPSLIMIECQHFVQCDVFLFYLKK